MKPIPHELPDEFPTKKHMIERLTKTNYEFGHLAAAYDEVNRHIWRIELRRRGDLRRSVGKAEGPRPLLKDDIAAKLTTFERRT